MTPFSWAPVLHLTTADNSSPTPIRWGGVQSPLEPHVRHHGKEQPVIDRITITGLTATGRHGVFPEERRDGQIFVVDVELHMLMDTRSDDLSSTVNYAEVADQVVEVITGEPCDLIETVAGRVADRCLAFDRVSDVVVTVHKPQAPVAHTFTDLSVTIHRSRHDEPPV